MAVKRRVIWMRDDEWAALQAIAKERGETISGVLRDFWKVASVATPSVAPMSQAQRDAILRRVNRAG